MEQEIRYSVKVTGPGISLEKDVPKDVGDQIVVLVLTGVVPKGASPPAVVPQRAGGLGGQSTQLKPVTGHDLPSLPEFFDETGPVRAIDKIVAIGVYKADYENSPTFSSASVAKAFESAGEMVPANLSRDIKSAVRSGWIAPAADEKGSYRVTRTGRQVVLDHFPPEQAKKAKSAKPASKARKKAGNPT